MEKDVKIKKFLDLIKKQEGGYLHYNKSESDITTGYGIYRVSYPNEKIFTYIDEVAASIGINSPSSKWSKDEIKLIDSKINKEKEFELTKDFYINTYFAKIDIFKLPIQMMFAVGSIYINGPKVAIKALQQSYNIMIKKLNLDNFNSISEDGIIGSGTRNAVYELSGYIEDDFLKAELWFSIFMSFCKSIYIELATDGGKEDKHLQYLKGWRNRVDDMINSIDDLIK